MAQYSLPGVYGWAQPDHPAAKVYVAPLDPGPYNLHSLKNTARPQLTTPAPRPGKSVQSAYFDRLGPTAAKLIVAPLLPGSKYSRGPLEKRGRMSFESVIPVPVPTDREYRFSFLKGDIEAAKQADREAPAATSIFSNMKPLQLVEALIKAAPDAEKKAAFEAVRNFLTRAELVKLNRPLTGQEQKEYDDIVNGLQINALEAYGDGSTQFASDIAYELGIQMGLVNVMPPPPPPPGPPPLPEGNFLGVNRTLVPIVSDLKLPDDAAIDQMEALEILPIIGSLVKTKADRRDVRKELEKSRKFEELKAARHTTAAMEADAQKDLEEYRNAAKQLIADHLASLPPPSSVLPSPSLHGSAPGSRRASLSLAPLSLDASSSSLAAPSSDALPLVTPTEIFNPSTDPNLADLFKTTTTTTTSSASATIPAAAVPPDPLAATTAASSTASTHPLIAGPQPAPAPGARIDSSTAGTTTIHTAATTAAAAPKAKKTGVEKKLPPMVRAMQAADYVNQPGATKTQKKNAELVVEAKGDLTDPKVKSAWDSMRQARKELHKKREWIGPWYKEEVWAAAEKAGLDHPSKLPTVGKEAAPFPGADPSAHMVGTGRGSGLPFAMPKRNWSQWSPSTW